eukprot:1994160-Ditylum_brightwellii.AAC.1
MQSETQSEKCPPNTPLPKKNKLFINGYPYLLEQNRRSGGQKTKEDSVCTSWNLKLFWNHFSTKKTGNDLYLLGSLTSSDNKTSDGSDDGELTVRKKVINPEKD